MHRVAQPRLLAGFVIGLSGHKCPVRLAAKSTRLHCFVHRVVPVLVTPHRTSIVSPGCLTDGLFHRADEDPVSPKVREGFPDFISRYSEPDSIGTGFIELQCVDAKDGSGCKVNEWATTVPMVHRCICLQEGHAIIGTDVADNALVNAPPVSSYHNNY
jgi:hypothetical protein